MIQMAIGNHINDGFLVAPAGACIFSTTYKNKKTEQVLHRNLLYIV